MTATLPADTVILTISTEHIQTLLRLWTIRHHIQEEDLLNQNVR